jgi:hypothetical protein
MKHATFGRKLRVGAAGLALGLGLSFGSASIARPAGEAAKAEEIKASAAYEEVSSFSMLGRPHSWTAIDNDTVIVWTTPFQPYLVELAIPSYDLRFALVIGVTSVGNRVYAGFVAVKVDGFRYPIDSIYKMSREEARNLTKRS